MPSRREFLTASAALLVSRRLVAEAGRAAPSVVTVYKDAGCGCCKQWVKHLSANGFVVNAHDVASMDEIKRTMLVPADLQSCHTAVVNRYVIEGHVPASDIRKLLAAKTPVHGLAVPGMPTGAPGMEGDHNDHYDVVAFTTDGKAHVFARH
jgi:hypothetical protein